MPVFTLIELDEPVFVLNGRLIRSDQVLVEDRVGHRFSYPEPFRPILTYFTKLRPASQVRADLAALRCDESDITAAVRHQTLLQMSPAPSWSAAAHQLSGIKLLALAPRSPVQNRPGQVLLTLPDTVDRVTSITELTASVLTLAMQQPVSTLGLAMQQVLSAHGMDNHERAWRSAGADLAHLLCTGAAAIAYDPWPAAPRATGDLSRRVEPA